MNYTHIDSFVFRTTYFPINQDTEKIISNEIFREGLFLASQDLYTELEKTKHLELSSIPDKTKLSLAKYANRTISRCTPFGLFAGIGLGKITESEDNFPFDKAGCEKHTRLDMQLMYKLYKYIVTQPEVFEKLIFTPNSTLYRIGKHIKYIELQDSADEFKYVISVVDRTTELEKVLKFAKKGVSFQQIVNHLDTLGHDHDDAVLYVQELTENKILLPNLNITTSGKEPLKKLIAFFQEAQIQNSKSEKILKIDKLLSETSNKWGKAAINNYKSIVQLISEIVDTKKVKNIFQVDLKIKAKEVNLNSNVIPKINDTLVFLNKLNTSNKNTALESFKKKFIERYENQLIPLLEALDPDVGIGFSDSSAKAAPNKLLENINFINNNVQSSSIYLTSSEEFLLRKYTTYLAESNGSQILELFDSDVEHLEENWDGFTETFCVMIDYISSDKIHFLGSFGSSAANLLGRFCHIDNRIYELNQSIIRFEDSSLKEDTLSAEVVHLPHPSVGNVLLRPQIREFEISVLNPTQASESYSIPASDLGLIIKGDRLVLWSYSLKKCIRPKITSAHIYSKNTLDIYNFLGHLQREYAWNEALFFSWGKLLNDKFFLPRVVLKGVILSPARWNFSRIDTKDIPDIKEEDFPKKAKAFLAAKNLPKEVLIVQGDNKLYVNFEKNVDIEIFFSMLKKLNGYVEEFLFENGNAFIKSPEGEHKNELLLFYRK